MPKGISLLWQVGGACVTIRKSFVCAQCGGKFNPTAVEIGQIIVKEFEAVGFAIQWTQTADTRMAKERVETVRKDSFL